MTIIRNILEARKELSDKQKLHIDQNNNGKIDSKDLEVLRAKRDDVYTSDYKLDKNGRKTKAHKISFKAGEYEVKGESFKPMDEPKYSSSIQSRQKEADKIMTNTQNKKHKDIAKGMKKTYKDFVQQHSVEEALKGDQHKLDKNKNGKLDKHDFKLLRKEDAEQMMEFYERSPEMTHHKLVNGQPKVPSRVASGHIHLHHISGTANSDNAKYKVLAVHAKSPLKAKVGSTISGTKVNDHMDDGSGGHVHVHSAKPDSNFMNEDYEQINELEFTEEDIENFMQTEEFEQLDELSKNLVHRYYGKAIRSHAATLQKDIDIGDEHQKIKRLMSKTNKGYQLGSRNKNPIHNPEVQKHLKAASDAVAKMREPAKKEMAKREKGIDKAYAKVFGGKDRDGNKVVKATGTLTNKRMYGEEVEQIEEAIYADDYTVTSEKSQFGGHRPHVVNKETGKTMMLGQHSYKSPEHAKAHAKAYLTAYAKLGMHAADRASIDYAKANKAHRVDEDIDMNEELHPEAHKVLKHIKPEHHAKYTPDMTTKHYTGNFADRRAVLSAAEKAGHLIKEASPFDWKNTPRQTSDKTQTSTFHDVKKTSTGTVYTKQRDADGMSKEFKRDPDTAKRGRGRPKKNSFGEAVQFLMGLDEETFDSFMEEGFDSFMEQYEQLDELSRATLGDYAKRASRDSTITRKIGADFENQAKKARSPGMKAASTALADKYKSKSWKRRDGVDQAIDKLTK